MCTLLFIVTPKSHRTISLNADEFSCADKQVYNPVGVNKACVPIFVQLDNAINKMRDVICNASDEKLKLII